MHDRGRFWSPVPDWSEVSLHAAGLDVSPVTVASICLVSGDVEQFLARSGIGEILGPRHVCSGGAYALRLAPDRAMVKKVASISCSLRTVYKLIFCPTACAASSISRTSI